MSQRHKAECKAIITARKPTWPLSSDRNINRIWQRFKRGNDVIFLALSLKGGNTLGYRLLNRTEQIPTTDSLKINVKFEKMHFHHFHSAI